MSEKPYAFERRDRPRFKMAAAVVEFNLVDRAGDRTRPKKTDLMDLSMKGLSFSWSDPLRLGTRLSLVLRIPAHKPVALLGRVKWRGRRSGISGYVHGVEFLPWGTGPGENDPGAKKELAALETEFLGQKPN